MSTPLLQRSCDSLNMELSANKTTFSQREQRASYLLEVPIQLRKFLFIPAGTNTISIILVSSSSLSAPK